MGESKKYVVYGMMAKCSEGTMENYISTDTGHGVVYQGQPVLNANDHQKGVNLTHFGDCNSKKIYEEAKKEIDEKYKAEEGDGFFTKLGKGIVKAHMKTAVFVQEHLMFHKCELDTPLPWIFTSKDHMIDGAPALTMESQCACRYGGIITIVPEEEGDNFENDKEPEAITENSELLTLAGVGLSASLNKSGEEILDAMLRVNEKVKTSMQKMREMKYINKYVNPETLVLINERWTGETLTEKYGDTFFPDLRESMYKVGITDERSVLMFLSSIGVESEYGTRCTERYNEGGVVVGNGYTMNTRGAGLIQVTGKTQKTFMEYLYHTLPEGAERDEVEKYWNGYTKDAEGNSINTYGSATDFIAKNYAIESAIWFWSVNTEKVATFKDGEKTDLTINEYIESLSDMNQDNVFLTVEYAVNGSPVGREILYDICKTPENVLKEGDEKLYINGEVERLPDHWAERRADWENAKELMEDEK